MGKIRVYRLSDQMGENAVIVSTIRGILEHVQAELQSMSLDMEEEIEMRLTSFSMDSAEFKQAAVNGRIE